jgi:hypothetical protein
MLPGKAEALNMNSSKPGVLFLWNSSTGIIHFIQQSPIHDSALPNAAGTRLVREQAGLALECRKPSMPSHGFHFHCSKEASDITHPFKVNISKICSYPAKGTPLRTLTEKGL